VLRLHVFFKCALKFLFSFIAAELTSGQFRNSFLLSGIGLARQAWNARLGNEGRKFSS
jgi:hypothetical protein